MTVSFPLPRSVGIQPYIDQVLSADSVTFDSLDGSKLSEIYENFKSLLMLPNQRIESWGLPSHGESKDDCGTFFNKGCLNVSEHPDNLGYFEPHVQKCYSPTCPVCWLFWCKRESNRITHRIAEHRKRFPRYKIIHTVASVPVTEYHLSVSALRKKAQSRVKQCGFWGGSCIFHPFRQDKPSGLWFFSPHFHFIGVGWLLGKVVSRLFKNDGWIVKNIGLRKSVFGTAFYQLTHAGVWYGKGKRHSVTWFGCMSYSKIKIAPLVTRDRSCPWCKQKLKSLVWVGGGDPPLPCGRGYLASADGWSTRLSHYYSCMVPREWHVDKYSEMSLYPPLDSQKKPCIPC